MIKVPMHSIDDNALRIVDLCAGIGGFHRAIATALACTNKRRRTGEITIPSRRIECVLACEINEELRSIYVRNFPSIEPTYIECYPPEDADITGLDLYDATGRLIRIHGDLNNLIEICADTHRLRRWPDNTSMAGKSIIPDHDLLCAGFPCQPFSKSGGQLGFDDFRGTVFGSIAVILEEKQPPYVLLENVGNFDRHDGGRTWRKVKQKLEDLDYHVLATSHRLSGQEGQGLISPHHLGYPQHRDRFFAVAQHRSIGQFEAGWNPLQLDHRLTLGGRVRQMHLAQKSRQAADRLKAILDNTKECATAEEIQAAQLSTHRVRCINLWNELLAQITETGLPDRDPLRRLPSFPIWGYELDPWNHYPTDGGAPRWLKNDDLLEQLRQHLALVGGVPGPSSIPFALSAERSYMAKPVDEWGHSEIARWRNSWPSYARRTVWPGWKERFITQNRDWGEHLWTYLDPTWMRDWLERLYHLPPSLQKLEWNCQGEELDLWLQILQFRPSGLRAKRFQHVPSLVAMTTTQIPIMPRPDGESDSGADPSSRGRFLLQVEALQVQGFPPTWTMPTSRTAAFAALGNAVHVGVVTEIVRSWLLQDQPTGTERSALASSSDSKLENTWAGVASAEVIITDATANQIPGMVQIRA